jgi:hypothetical protein
MKHHLQTWVLLLSIATVGACARSEECVEVHPAVPASPESTLAVTSDKALEIGRNALKAEYDVAALRFTSHDLGELIVVATRYTIDSPRKTGPYVLVSKSTGRVVFIGQ